VAVRAYAGVEAFGIGVRPTQSIEGNRHSQKEQIESEGVFETKEKVSKMTALAE
jgi:hypothetical protein